MVDGLPSQLVYDEEKDKQVDQIISQVSVGHSASCSARRGYAAMHQSALYQRGQNQIEANDA